MSTSAVPVKPEKGQVEKVFLNKLIIKYLYIDSISRIPSFLID